MATNRALNKTAACKDYYLSNATYAAGKAVDGNLSTYWMSATGLGTWWSVDLAAPYAINGVKISWENNYNPIGYRIEYSDDNTNWTTWISRRYAKSSGRVDEFKYAASGSHQYWRVYINEILTQTNSAIKEIGLYDDSTYENPEITADTDLAMGRDVTVSGIYQAGYEAIKINDGGSGTRWASNTSGAVWVYIDLNDPIYSNNKYKIDKAHIVWEGKKTVSIQYSDNAVDWADAVTNHLGATNDEAVEWTQATAHRYWRLSMGTTYSSIFTLQLFTSDPPTGGGETPPTRRRYAQII